MKTKGSTGDAALFFGIDSGTSYTKVAYVKLNTDGYEQEAVKYVQDWSALGAQANDTAYLPTVLAYDKGRDLLHSTPVQAGFLNDQQRANTNLEIFEGFKESFPGNVRQGSDAAVNNGAANSESTDTMILYWHFLEKLHDAIKSYTIKIIGLNWDEIRIDFMFSVPIMWNRADGMQETVTQRFEKVAAKAGFVNSDTSGLHTMFTTLSEPEAAAAFSLQAENGLYKDGDSVLVVDAGRSTTDMCLVKIENAHRGQLSIDPLSVPTGKDLGSSHIDHGFEELASDKLKSLARRLNASWDVEQMSHVMRWSRDFQDSKMELTLEKAMSDEHFTVAIPNIDQLTDLLDMDDLVQSPNRLRFTWRELATIFDAVIDDRQVLENGRPRTEPGIAKLIHRTRDHVIHQATDGGAGISSDISKSTVKDVDMILLAGGLGQSSYLRDRIRMSLSDRQNPDAFQPLVRTLAEPQLCICRGLLANRLFEMFRAQRCNANYGVLQDKALKPWKPMHLMANLSNRYRYIGGKRYMRRVEWLVEEGNMIPDKTPSCIHIFEEAEQKVVEIVISRDGKAQHFAKPGDYIAKIDCDANHVVVAEDERTGKPYCEVELIFNTDSFHVKCWSPRDLATRQLIGEYKRDFDEVVTHS